MCTDSWGGPAASWEGASGAHCPHHPRGQTRTRSFSLREPFAGASGAPPPPSCWAIVKPGPRSGSPPRHSDELRNGRSSDLKSQPTRVPRGPRIWAPCVPSGLRCADSRGTLVCRLVCVQFTAPLGRFERRTNEVVSFKSALAAPEATLRGTKPHAEAAGGLPSSPEAKGVCAFVS